MSRNNRLLFGIVSSLILVSVIVLVVVVHTKRAMDEARQQEISALKSELSVAVTTARQSCKEWHFNDARDALEVMRPRVSTLGNKDICDQFDQAVVMVGDAERDYRKKVDNGLIPFEGRLVPPGEKNRVLAERQRQVDNKDQENEKLLAEKRQQAKNKHQELQQERFAQAKKEEFEKLVLNRVESGVLYMVESGAIQQIGDVDVALGCLHSTVYIPLNANDVMSNMPHFGIFFPVWSRRTGEQFSDTVAGFIAVNDVPKKVEFESSDKSIVDVYQDGSARFVGNGKAIVTVRVAGESLSVTVTVVQLPVKSASNPDQATKGPEVIRLLGMPDEREKHFVEWPHTRVIDGIVYSPEGYGIYVDHWKYEKFPGMVISMVGNGGWVRYIGTYEP